MGQYSGKYVKNEYYKNESAPEKSIDVEIAIDLKKENKAFKVENTSTVIHIAGEQTSQFYTTLWTHGL